MFVVILSLYFRINLVVQSYFFFYEMENEKNYMYKIVLFEEKIYYNILEKIVVFRNKYLKM